MDERAVSELQALRERDEALAAAAAGLGERSDAIAALRRRVEGISAFLARFPEEALSRRAAVEAASAEVTSRRGALAAAEVDLEGHHDDETFDRLRRIVARAEERLAAAVSRHERAVADLEELEGDAAELPAELVRLADEAHALGAAPDADAAGLIEWASRTHAELFVTAGQLDRQREQVIREANELASMLLGEPTYGSTVAQALARVEQP